MTNTHNISDYHQPLPDVVAQLKDIEVTDEDIIAVFMVARLEGDKTIQKDVRLMVGDRLPIGHNTNSNWNIGVIRRDRVMFSNEACFFINDSLEVTLRVMRPIGHYNRPPFQSAPRNKASDSFNNDPFPKINPQ